MLVKIIKLWNIQETKKVPLFDANGNHVVIVDPFTSEAIPQYKNVPYKEGDIIDLTNAEAQIKAGQAVEVNPDGSLKIPIIPLSVDNKGESSGRQYYWRKKRKFKDDKDFNKDIKEETEKVVGQLSKIFLLYAGQLFGIAHIRQKFLDRETQGFLNAFQNKVTVESKAFVDDCVRQYEILNGH